MSDDSNGGDDRGSVPRETVDRQFDRAEQMLADATTANEVDISTATVVNRLYYACFHAAQAALYARGFEPRSHGRVGTLLGRELIQTGEVPREHGRFLNDMATYRRRVDYGSGGIERNVEELIDGTTEFLEAMRKVIDEDQSNG